MYIYIFKYIYIYIIHTYILYIYICVCVCLCQIIETNLLGEKMSNVVLARKLQPKDMCYNIALISISKTSFSQKIYLQNCLPEEKAREIVFLPENNDNPSIC